MTVTGPLTLYAKWDPEIFTITWELNGGTSTAILPDHVEYGDVLTRPNPNPTKEGHAFRGWYTDAGLTALHIFTLPVTTDLNLYAKWEQSVVQSGARYLAFTSDVHWSSTAAKPIYEEWMDKLMTQVPSLDYMGFCGDLGYPSEANPVQRFWDNVKILMDTAEKYVDNGFITGTNSGLPTDGNLFGLGNHEWYTSGGGNLQANPTGYAQDRLMPNHTVIDEGDYIIYALGPVAGGEGGCGQRFVQTEIDKVSAYLATAPSNVPIFIMAHHPIHIFDGGTPNRTTENADSLLDVLQEYPNVFFMWGHNHSVLDPMWDKFSVAGDPIQTTTNSNSKRDLNFTYFPPGVMRDAEYAGDSNSKFVYGKGTVAKIENGVVTLTYYDKDCEPLTGDKYRPVGETIENPVTVTIEGGGGPVVPRFIVTFNKNHSDAAGFTNANPSTKTVTSPATTVGTLPAEPTRAGYDFNGWNTAPNGSGAPFTASTPVTVGITVYAQWAAVTTVTFDKNGGTTEANPSTKRIEPPATNVGTLPAEPTRTGYTFTGWTTQPSGGSPFTATTTVTTSITVYAQWTLKPYVPGDPYSVNLSGQTTKFVYHTANNNTYSGLENSKIKLDFPAGFNINDYSKVTVKYDFFQATSPDSAIATTTSCYVDAYFFAPWVEEAWGGPWSASATGATATVTGTGPGMLQRLGGKTGTSDANSASNNNGFTFDISTLTTLPAGLQVNKHAGNSLGIIEVTEIRFHNDP
jgi:uncharacterized repeat protein (TIGR02543 family)